MVSQAKILSKAEFKKSIKLCKKVDKILSFKVTTSLHPIRVFITKSKFK